MSSGAIGRHFAFISLFLMVPIALVGCRGSEFESTVTGTVTLDGKPLDHGTVVFKPVDGMSNPAMGSIDTSSRYSLETTKMQGLNPGEYNVSVSSYEIDSDRPIGERQMEAELITPKKYANADTSGLQFTVEPGKNTINITLKSNEN